MGDALPVGEAVINWLRDEVALGVADSDGLVDCVAEPD